MRLSQSQTAVILVLLSLLTIIAGVWVVFGVGWAAIIGGLIGIVLGFGFAYDAVASAQKAEK